MPDATENVKELEEILISCLRNHWDVRKKQQQTIEFYKNLLIEAFSDEKINKCLEVLFKNSTVPFKEWIPELKQEYKKDFTMAMYSALYGPWKEELLKEPIK